MAVSTQTKQLLQELYIFATGQAANTSEMAMIEALVGENGNLDDINKLIDTYINQKAQQHGVVGMVKILANNGMGVTLTDAEANAAIADFSAAGLTTWSSLFQWAAANESIYGVTLTNRGDAASYFTDALAKSDKTDLFAGTSINTAVSNLLKTISETLTSVSTAQQGLDELAARLTENGLTSAVVDGYLAGATIFADANGNGVLDPDTEWSATTDENGNYVLPVNLPAGSLIAFGGTDLLTGQAFQGVLSAPAGSTVVTPLTSMIQALIENDPDTDIATATNNVRSALNLPGDVDLQTYDPIAVLNNSSASDADKAKALAIQNVSLQVANVLTQAGNALSAANGATTLQSATGAVTKALAAALSGGGAFDLGNQSSLSSVLNSAANASASPLTPDQINQITTITAQSNAAAASATTITALAKVAVVAQGSATTAIIEGTTSDTLGLTVSNFTGDNFTNSVNAATPINVPGSTTTPDPTPTPTPTPPATTFLATLDSSGLTNVVSFSGTATGEITISFTTTGASTKDATFTRAGISATKLTNYDGSAVTVTIANGQSLSSDAANLTNLGALSGAGNVIVTGTPSINELSGINVSGLTGTLTYSHVTDVANKLDQASDSIYENTAVNVTVTDGDTASIAQLNQIDALWGTVTPQRVTDIANNLDEAADSQFENTTINVTVTDAATLAQLAQIDALWGTVSYTSISDSIAALVANTGGYITGAVNLTVTDSATIAQLNTVDGYTSGTVTAPQITDSAATIAASSYVSATTAVALSSGTAAAVDLSTIDGMTTVALDASAVTTLTGTAAQITAAYTADTAGTITGLGNEIATASDTGTVAATVLTDLDALTTGAVGFASVTTLTGTAAQITAAYAANTAGTITGLDDEIATASDTGTVAATVLTDLDALTTGAVGFASVTTLTGTAAQITAAYAAKTAGTITGLGDEIAAVSDTGTIAATVLTDLDALTSGAVGFAAVTTLTGTAAQITAAYAANTAGTITGLGDEIATASDTGTVAATVLTDLDALTSGAVGFASVTTLTGTAAQITAAYAANTAGTITGLGNEIATASDTGTVAATVLTDLDPLTTGAVGFASVTTLTGTAVQVAAAYTANTAGAITGLNDEAVILSGSASALDITAIKTGNSAGTINGSALTAINGSAAAVAQALAALDNAPTNFNAALTGSASAGEIATIVGAVGTGTIDYSGITTLVVTSSTDITGFTWAATATSLDATASAAINVTMTMAQHNAFTTAINANGANDTITFTDVGTFTADADIKTYALKVGDNSVTTGADGQIFQTNAENTSDVLTLSGSHNVSVELSYGSLSAGSATGAITVSSVNAVFSNTIATGSGDDVISVGAGADNIDGGAGDDIFLITSNADVARLPLTGPFNTINGGTHSSGDTLRIIGTTEAYLPTATITGIEILDLTTSASVQTVHITAAQLGALTTVTADASDVLFISSLDGATIGHTNAIDHFSFDDADSNVSITSFSTAVDQVGFSSMKHTGGKAEVTGNISAVNDGKIWFLGNQSAGAADSLANSAAALSAAAIWGNPAGNYTNYVVLADDDSTALYKLNDVSASADEIVSSELTLIGVVNGVLGIGNINTSIEPFADPTGA